MPGELYTYAKAAEEQPVLRINGKIVDYRIEKGFAVIGRTWKKGDQVELDLPMSVKVSHCHKAVEANHNRIALTEVPLFYVPKGSITKEQHSVSFSIVTPQISQTQQPARQIPLMVHLFRQLLRLMN